MESKLDFNAVNKFFNSPLPKPPSKPSSTSPTAKQLQERPNLINIWSTLPNVPVYHTPHTPQSPVFNPNAPTFVPSHHRGLSCPHPNSPAGQGPNQHHSQAHPQLPGTRPAWFASFLAGSATASANEHAAHANVLVSHLPCGAPGERGQMRAECLAELAQLLCLQASSPDSNGLAVAAFAKAVYTELRANPAQGEWAAGSFSWHLKECMVNGFSSCWRVMLTLPNTSLSLCTFVGHLFMEALIPSSVVKQCLQLLLSELRTSAYINHLHAIYALLHHSSEKLWWGKEAGQSLRDLVVMIGQRVSAVTKWNSLEAGGAVGRVRKEEVEKLLRNIVNMLNRWQSARFMSPIDTSAEMRGRTGH